MRKENQTNELELYREYKGQRGFSLDACAMENGKFAYLENMYIDREGGGLLESVPGYRRLFGAEDKIHSLALQNVGEEKFIIFHSGKRLYKGGYKSGECSLIAEISDNESRMISLGSLVLINDSERLYSLDSYGVLKILSEEKYILGCKSVAIFDGRLFFSANKEFEGEIFYSSILTSEGISFSRDNSIYDGGDISHILAHRGKLWVFRSSESRIPEITCHESRVGYPICLTLEGVNPIASPIAIDGEIFLLTNQGLLAIEILDGSEARISNYSLEINPMLLRENLKEANLLIWKGYILIGCGEHIYLGDRFSEGKDPDWYFINQIGAHIGDKRVFRYERRKEEGYDLHKLPDEKAEGEIISFKREDGRIIYYSDENGKKYLVYPTEERDGGILLPAIEYLSDKDLLLFFAGSGIYIFNSDMRGVAPNEIRTKPDFDKKEYERLYGRVIHKSFYSFDQHTPKYVIATCYDDCGIPFNKKSAIGQSLRLKFRTGGEGRLRLKINTDSEKNLIHIVRLNPGEDTSIGYEASLSSLSITEKAHLFGEKQIVLEVEDYCSPIAFHSLAFRYLTQEKLKKG